MRCENRLTNNDTKNVLKKLCSLISSCCNNKTYLKLRFDKSRSIQTHTQEIETEGERAADVNQLNRRRPH